LTDFNPNNKYIVHGFDKDGNIISTFNEICSCGHLGGKSQNSDHSDHYQKGHGKCNKCDCVKFTWVSRGLN
jgi:hypothetical protein